MKNIFGGDGGGSRLIDSEKFIKVYLFLPMLCQLNKSKETMKKKKKKKKHAPLQDSVSGQPPLYSIGFVFRK